MIELPEAATIATQATRALTGATVAEVEANHTPHKLVWFFGDPDRYAELLTGATFTGAEAVGGHVELIAGDLRVLLSEGAQPTLLDAASSAPAKHQLRIGLADGRTLVVSVAMYGGIQVFHDGENDNPYYLVARRKPSPLTGAFDAEYFRAMLDDAGALSAKAFLATEQRVPGLGNGTLQDVLWNARVNPRRKVASLDADERSALFDAVVTTLGEMAAEGGRDTERDLFGRPGGYATAMSRKTLETGCRRCDGRVVKESYLGGAVYFCATCQPRPT